MNPLVKPLEQGSIQNQVSYIGILTLPPTSLTSGEGNVTPLQYSCLEDPMDGGAWWAAVHGVANGRTRLSDFTFTFQSHALEKEMATHSSVLAWRIPGTAEPGALPSMESQSWPWLKRLSSSSSLTRGLGQFDYYLSVKSGFPVHGISLWRSNVIFYVKCSVQNLFKYKILLKTISTTRSLLFQWQPYQERTSFCIKLGWPIEAEARWWEKTQTIVKGESCHHGQSVLRPPQDREKKRTKIFNNL